MNEGRGPRRTTARERELFQRTVDGARPLEGGRAARKKPQPRAFEAAPEPPPAARPEHVPERAPKLAAKHAPKAKARRRAGPPAVEARLDLHGLTLAEAHRALDDFVRQAQAAGRTRLLVITGKGGRRRGAAQTDMENRARLSLKVPLWLERRAGVAGLERAHPRHGGDGALYVILRSKS